MGSTSLDQINIPVVVVGGGGCGLTISSILSDQGVEHVLLERHEGTSILPKTSNLNQRTMEIFRQHGISESIYAAGAPSRNMSLVFWQTSLGGSGPHDRRVIGKLPCYGGSEGMLLHEIYKRDSPALGTNLPLIRAEPLLRAIAEDRNPDKIFFGHTVTDIAQDDVGVLVTVQRPDDSFVHYRAQYVVAADGGKTIGPKIGVILEGDTRLEVKVSVHFKADLSEYWDDRSLITHFINPEGGSVTLGGTLIPMGPTWGRRSEEWAINFGHRLDDPERFNEGNLVPRLRELLKLPTLEVEVLHISHWIQERVLANKYREGRVFVAGDAAHRHPPTSGLGLNSGIGDAHNLAWKLALTVKGQAHSSLLDTYERERRPVAVRNCDRSVLTNMNRQVLSAALGLVPGQVEANRQRFDRLLDNSESGRTIRAHITRIIQTQDIEFSAHDVEIGPRYPTDVGLEDSGDEPPLDPLGKAYHPTTRPGHRLPHAWLLKDGKKFSTHDLVGKNGSFCLITDESGGEWVRCAERISANPKLITVGSARIKSDRNKRDADIEDWDDSWSTLRQIDDGGAILVRPDNYVARRSRGRSHRNGEELKQAIELILGITE